MSFGDAVNYVELFLGTDGGGSIRIPASYCGVVGLKATFARFNLSNMRGLSNTVGHAGEEIESIVLVLTLLCMQG